MTAHDEKDRLKSDGEYTYGWDENGNLTSRIDADGSTTYKYDPENRLIEANGPNGLVQFGYDAQGNRISRTTTSGVTTFVVDPNMPYAQILEESGPSGAKVYSYGNDMLNMQGPEGTRWFAYDGLGSTRALTDNTGTLTDAYTYEVFGTVVHHTGTSANDFQFTGEQYEAALDMYYLRARYYEPESGRFGARDRWTGRKTHPETLNKYSYANGNPASFVDLSGLMGDLTLGNLALTMEVQEREITPIYLAYSQTAVKAYTITVPRIILTTAIMLSLAIGPVVGELITEMLQEEAGTQGSEGNNSYGQTLVYRWGSKSNTNLTPREVDVNGLSFSTVSVAAHTPWPQTSRNR